MAILKFLISIYLQISVGKNLVRYLKVLLLLQQGYRKKFHYKKKQMSTSNTPYLIFISQQITIYAGLAIFIAGVIGNILNAIVFLSLKTFRQSPCAFFLTVMALVNTGQLITGFFIRIMISGFNIDWTIQSTFVCKLKCYIVSVCTSVSFTCMCLATIDQFLATCPRPSWQQWSNIKVARRMIGIFTIVWIIHNILYLIYFDRIESSTTGKYSCTISNEIFQQYFLKVYTLVYIGFLPIFICTLFGLLAYYNINHLSYRTVPVVRRELDKQLTTIVLMQALFVFIAAVPYLITVILGTDGNIVRNPVVAVRLQFASTITLCIYYVNFGVSSKTKGIKCFCLSDLF